MLKSIVIQMEVKYNEILLKKMVVQISQEKLDE
jgi:hypothetical protein